MLRSDLGALTGGRALKESVGQFGGNLTTALTEAFRAASTPVKDAFEASIGSALSASLNKMTADATHAFTGLATGVSQALGGMEDAVRGIVERVLGQIRSGSAEIVTAIADQVEEKLVRRMQQAAKAQ